MTNKTFREMTDAEIKIAFSRLAISCQHSNDPKKVFQRRVKEDFDCPYSVAIAFSNPNRAGQRMWMGMVGSPSTGKTINF